MGQYRVEIFFGNCYKDGLNLYIDEEGNLKTGMGCIDKTISISDEISEEEFQGKILEEADKLARGVSQSEHGTTCFHGRPAGVLGRVYAFVYNKHNDLVKVYTVKDILNYPYSGKSTHISSPAIKGYSAEEFYKKQGLSDEAIRQGEQKLSILGASDAIGDRNISGFMGALLALAETYIGYIVIKDPKTFPTFLSWLIFLGALIGIDLIPTICHGLKVRYFKNKLANGLEQDPNNMNLLNNCFSTYVKQQREKMFRKTM